MSEREPQLALFELPASPPGPKPAKKPRPARMPPAQVARHCNALLAELDRVAQAHYRRADHLARLFEAAERAQLEERARRAREAGQAAEVGKAAGE